MISVQTLEISKQLWMATIMTKMALTVLLPVARLPTSTLRI